jgi:two-component system, NarL family, nitrate/nitrite response regulator NarL
LLQWPAESALRVGTHMNDIDPSAIDLRGATSRTVHTVRVVIADDESMFRTSLRQLLSAPAAVVKDVFGVDVGDGFEVVGEAGSGQETIETVRSAQPDLLLLDISMPRANGLEALRDLGPSLERTHTIILSATMEKAQLLTAIRLGARGVVPKDSPTEQLFDAVMRVMAGEFWIGQSLISDLVNLVRSLAAGDIGAAHRPFGLTPREREVLTLVVEGCPNKEIAQRFSVSEETIKHHLTRMFDKVGATNRLELALTATRHGLVN